MFSSTNNLISKLTGKLGTRIKIYASKKEDPRPLRVATSPWPGYEFLYLARKLGKLEKSQVKLVDLASASEVMYAMKEGALDAAALTLDETIHLVECGIDLKVVLLFDISIGSNALLARPEISSVEDIKNIRIGVEENTVASLMLESALNHSKLTRSDIQLISLPLDQHLHAYVNGEVDALVSFGSVKSQLKKMGAGVLFDSGWVSGRVVNVLAVRTDAMDNRLKNIQLLVNAHFKALEHFRTMQDKSAKAIAGRLQISTEELLQLNEEIETLGLEENRMLLHGSSPPFNITLQKLIKFMTECGLLKNQFLVNNLIDSRFLLEDSP